MQTSMNSNSDQFDFFLISLKFSDYLFKILLIGNSGVGKSCMLMRYAVNLFLNFKFSIMISFCKNKDNEFT